MPGSAEELAAIASKVIGGRSRNQRQVDEPRLQRVTKQLLHVASTVLADLQQQVSAPTAKEVEMKLMRISRISWELTEDLHSLPPFSLDLLNTVYHAQRGWDDTVKARVKLGLGTAPIELVASAINVAAEQELDRWRNGTILGRIPPDRPGPQRAFQRIIGDPRIFLADQVAQMIAQEQGTDVVTAEETGPVYEVVALLWTYATGLSDEGANLRHYVRRGTRSATLLAQLRAVEDEIKEERISLYSKPEDHTDPRPKREVRLRIEELEARAHSLAAEAHAALWDYDRDVGLDSPSG